ncbi:MAG: transposase [Bacteroidales bacterium]|nr:transposase [Bacteroidales bacterium]
MFKKSDDNPQLGIFSSPTEYLKGSTMNYYLKNDSWHNRFRSHVVMRVDESIFSVLYTKGTGAPNASIRVLVGMMILKEGQGWSDEQLFENCNFNLLIRSALGLMSLEDAAPVASTYYLFRRNLVEYAKEHGEDLFKKCQAQITRDQLLEFEVSGKRVRMDSKLVGSNIAWYSRYELIHETLRLFIDERQDHIYNKSLPKEVFSLIESIQGETGNKVLYRSTKEEVDERFVELGKLMYRFIGLFKRYDYGHYQALKTVFEQQYSVSKDKIVLPLDKEKVSAKSIQSPHDTDCHYRDKDGNKVKGYSVNVTETCDQPEDGKGPVLNLITDTEVTVASAPDNGFLEQALDNTQEIVSDKIEKVYADGAYHSVDNQEYCQSEEHGIDLILTGIQGPEPRYDIHLDEQDENNLIVTDNKTGETIQAQRAKPRKDNTQRKWRIKTDTGKYRYFDEDNLRTAALRQKLKDIPIEETNIRNNVEASIFQLGFHYPNDKSRYRSLAKHQLWAYSRSLWINFVRVVNYITRISQRPLFGQKLPQCITNLCFNMYIIVNMLAINKNNHIRPAKLIFSAI